MNQKYKFVRKYWPAAGILLIFAFSLLWEWRKPARENPPVTKTEFAMDTVIQYCLYGYGAEQAMEQCRELLSDMERQLTRLESHNVPLNGDVLEINRMAGQSPVKVSSETFDLLSRSQELNQWTGGLFDITIGPLVELWNIMGENPTVPVQEDINAALALVGNDLVLDKGEQTAFLPKKGQSLDLGAVAKGYTCSLLRDICHKNGVVKGYISLGGNMMVLEESSGMRFGLQDPLRGGEASVIASFSLDGQTMATAGGYERYFEQDGIHYCHILDLRTGWPAQTDLLSASVISPDGALADALSTALFLMGREEAAVFLKSADCSAILVDSDRRIWLFGDVAEGLQFQLVESSGYRIAEF